MSALRAIGQVMSGLVLQSKMKSSDMFEEKGKVFMKYANDYTLVFHIYPPTQSPPSPPPALHFSPTLHFCSFPILLVTHFCYHACRYFKLFMALIHSLNKIQWSEMSPIHKQPLQRHCASLREHTIKAMSNMLTANIDSGLIHAIGVCRYFLGQGHLAPTPEATTLKKKKMSNVVLTL